MSKKVLFSILGLLMVAGVSGGFFYYRQQTKIVNPSSEKAGETQTGSGEAKPLATQLYEDEAGFSFQYPQGLGVIEKEVNDSSTYSSLELSSKVYPNEKIVIKITDTNFASVEKWLAKNPVTGELETTSVTSFSGISGQVFKYQNPPKNLVLAVDSGILYYFEFPVSNDLWKQAFDNITQSFKLTEPSTAGNNSSGGVSSSVIDEGEEVL